MQKCISPTHWYRAGANGGGRGANGLPWRGMGSVQRRSWQSAPAEGKGGGLRGH